MKCSGKNVNYTSEDELPAVLHPRQAAEFLGCNINRMYKLCRSNKFPARKIGQKWIIPKRGFLNWLNSDQ